MVKDNCGNYGTGKSSEISVEKGKNLWEYGYADAADSANYENYYADINGDGKIDGIIYTDLRFHSGESSEWGTFIGAFTIPNTVTTTNVKDYVVSNKEVVDTRWDTTARKVISLASEQKGTATEERFYVMGLENLTRNGYSTLYWYIRASNRMSTYASDTNVAFGKGRENTKKIVDIWTAGTSGAYGAGQNAKDLWGLFPLDEAKWPKVLDTDEYRWFIASRGEWAAFARHLGITVTNYGSKNLSANYWASSQSSAKNAWNTYFEDGYMTKSQVSVKHNVRASATF